MSVAMGSRRRPRHRSRFRAMPRPPLDERPDEQPGGVPAGTGAVSSDGAAASADDLADTSCPHFRLPTDLQVPLVRIAPQVFPEADSWESLKSGRDGYSLVSFLKEIFPRVSFSDIKLLEIAFQLVKEHEMIQLNWSDPLHRDPENCDSDAGKVVYHGTSPLRAPAIRRDGLLPSRAGASCSTPALYCSPLRTTCFGWYCKRVRFPTIDKVFVLIFGVLGGKKKGSFKRGKKKATTRSGLSFRITRCSSYNFCARRGTSGALKT